MKPAPPSLAAKLNLAPQSQIVVLNRPQELPVAQRLPGIEISSACPRSGEIRQVLVFVTRLAEVERFAARVAERAAADAVVWFAYPKGGSKRYTCEFNRDSGWQALGEKGYEPVRMIAFDDDWSALRFRRAEFIRNMTRKRALSAGGKARVQP
ncbi:MAG TPA: hypothetical protein VN709_00830 [Terriglobales bacterium]|nr:hypothetical protein [Terriglobales bacterium]